MINMAQPRSSLASTLMHLPMHSAVDRVSAASKTSRKHSAVAVVAKLGLTSLTSSLALRLAVEDAVVDEQRNEPTRPRECSRGRAAGADETRRGRLHRVSPKSDRDRDQSRSAMSVNLIAGTARHHFDIPLAKLLHA